MLANKVKASNIKKARPYYEAKEKARKVRTRGELSRKLRYNSMGTKLFLHDTCNDNTTFYVILDRVTDENLK